MGKNTTVAKKASASKATSKKTPATKKTKTNKSQSKSKPVSSQKRSAASKSNELKSFRLCRDSQNFFSAQITLQTVYWSILAIAILGIGVKVLLVQLDTLDTLDALLVEI